MAARKRFMGLLEGDFQQCTFETFCDQYNQEALLRAVEFATRPQGILVLWGGNGRGKTHLLAAIYNRLQEYGAPAKYFSLPDLTSRLRSLMREDEGETPEVFYQYVSQFPIVLLDDIDYADIRRWTREQMFRLFNRRYINHQQVGTVLAMEFDPGQNGEMKWLFSRVNDERMVVVQMTGPDNRKQIGMLQRLLKLKRGSR
jgi:chromosomal replication initiation ATPase DnaA